MRGHAPPVPPRSWLNEAQGRTPRPDARTCRKRRRSLAFALLGACAYFVATSRQPLLPCQTYRCATLPNAHGKWNYLAGTRIGEAAHPGPGFDFSEIDDALNDAAGYESEDDAFPALAEDSSDDEDHSPPRGPLASGHESDSDGEAACDASSTRPHSETQTGASATATATSDCHPARIPSWDWPFGAAQLTVWRAAEAAASCTIGGLGHINKKAKRWTQPKSAGKQPPAGKFTAAATCTSSFEGFTFKTADLGTGYYRDEGPFLSHPAHGVEAASPEPTQEAMRRAASTQPDRPSGRARRDRGKDGKRRKKSSRLARLAALIFPPIIAATGVLADSDWKSTGLWAIDTANTNCMDSAHAKVLPKSAADMVLLQETKVRTADDAAAAIRRLRKEGWNAHVEQARTTEAGRGSGGCAVAARRGTGITPVERELVSHDLRHRITAAHVNAVIPGGLYFISVYLKDSEGLSEYNLRVLQEAAALALTLGTPWIMAGDWNVDPSRLQGSNWLKMIKGTVFACELPTCKQLLRLLRSQPQHGPCCGGGAAAG